MTHAWTSLSCRISLPLPHRHFAQDHAPAMETLTFAGGQWSSRQLLVATEKKQRNSRVASRAGFNPCYIWKYLVWRLQRARIYWTFFFLKWTWKTKTLFQLAFPNWQCAASWLRWDIVYTPGNKGDSRHFHLLQQQSNKQENVPSSLVSEECFSLKDNLGYASWLLHITVYEEALIRTSTLDAKKTKQTTNPSKQ